MQESVFKEMMCRNVVILQTNKETNKNLLPIPALSIVVVVKERATVSLLC